MTGKFFVVGLSYKKSDLTHRSRFAFNHDECRQAYDSNAIHFFILSTCNRTEVYGYSENETVLVNLLQKKADCNAEEFAALAYKREGEGAINHFFRVAAGLDSQIPGDYEIIAQIKSAFMLAKQQGKTDGFMEKIFNFALQASKEIKNTTSFSDGTISVAWSVASQLIKDDIQKVTVLGAGDTGELVIRYLQKLRPGIEINLVNRDQTKLTFIAGTYDVVPFPIAMLDKAISESEALVVTTNAHTPLVDNSHVEGSRLKVIFDLSVPRNVHDEVYYKMTVFDVDSVSTTINATIEGRLREVPAVESIIVKHIEEFKNWSLRRQLYSELPQRIH